jgi:hypothetical protein
MKVHQLLCLLCAVALALPMVANAQVYKWKDKSGKVHYTDTPPPSNVQTKTIGKEKVKKPVANTTPPSSEEIARDKFEEELDPEEEAAKLRQRNAEIEKNNKREQESQAKLDVENCAAARANYQTYAQGGRIYRTLENGEREYLGDDDLDAGKRDAQNEIDEYC